MEFGEIWVKQNEDREDGSGEQLIMSSINSRRRYENNWNSLKRYCRQCSLIQWFNQKFAATDQAKRADYLSSSFTPFLFILLPLL
ncbi:unnamed protein product [Thelazia callipaeda]|uniref:Ovule protein n=1 Tax=Thelazia callipaeda TaxID=103827 RepID=A0A0N5D6F3_THECL|nr:unnamed protein product [Thelazia callipaeda]